MILTFQTLVFLAFWWINRANAWKRHGRCHSTFCSTLQSERRGNNAKASSCYLFPQQPIKPKNLWKLSGTEYKCLIGTDLPWTVELKASEPSINQQKLTIRLMELTDLESIVTMNVQEYGSGPAYFPLTNPSLMGAWIDRQYIRWLVEISCRMKLLQYQQQQQQIDDSSYQTAMIPPSSNDHAILVGVLNDCDAERKIVGMIEVSLQPLNPKVTPSPIPIPVDIKSALAKATTGSSNLVGWITNLLVVPSYRGCGYSRILVDASEQVARSWNCTTSMHLHCDADPISGRIPQKLYASLGYRSPQQSVRTSNANIIFQPNVLFTTPPYVVEIEGVPLLYLCKLLSSNQ